MRAYAPGGDVTEEEIAKLREFDLSEAMLEDMESKIKQDQTARLDFSVRNSERIS